MRHLAGPCLDCGKPLTESDHFCPNCGQENRELQLRLKDLLSDFMSNYFAFDSKLGRSLHHFFLRPGYLTRHYNEGKRVRYVHPLRLYLIISVLFFFFLSYLLAFQLQEASFQLMANEKSSVTNEKDSVAMAQLRENPRFSAAADTLIPQAESSVDGFQKILQWIGDKEMTDEVLMDSLGVQQATRNSENFQLLLKQSRRVVQKDMDVFIPYVLKNLPLMMFLLLPIFALYLKMLFRNKPNFYISHIIHALHIHSMAFLLLSLFLIIGWASGYFFFWVTFLLITLYAFLSVKQVYQKGWARTLLNFCLLGMFYFSTFFVFMLAETAYSFLTF
ncbi:DUF3667 domain-containing protein [Nafulsella turpanensis]|uniref:DUF3667 domain-containing protein n=1 Tax=Nafulsella turpanensis TaxID=1265690 RepID=UPI0003458162|nr:DUF3667 domain-containing protein [Nafulsella turpanensis]